MTAFHEVIFIVLTTKFVLFTKQISNKVLGLKIHLWPDVPHPCIPIMSWCYLLVYLFEILILWYLIINDPWYVFLSLGLMEK